MRNFGGGSLVNSSFPPTPYHWLEHSQEIWEPQVLILALPELELRLEPRASTS